MIADRRRARLRAARAARKIPRSPSRTSTSARSGRARPPRKCRARSPTGSRRSCRSCPASTRSRPTPSPASPRFPSCSRIRRRRATCRCCSCCCARRWPTCRADLPPEVIGPIVNDEFGDVDSVLYTIDRRRRELRAAEAGRRGASQARCSALPDVDQGRSLRRPGRADLRRVQPRQARHARRVRAGDPQLARQTERAGSRGRVPDRRAARAAARQRRGAGSRGGRGDAGVRQRPDVPARRHRDRHARL